MRRPTDLLVVRDNRAFEPWPGTFLDTPTWSKTCWIAGLLLFAGFVAGYALRMKQDVYRASVPPLSERVVRIR